MYKDFFGFAREPFPLHSDPEPIFLTESHIAILGSLIFGITEKKGGFLLLTGRKGIGKTSFIHHLMHTLDPNIKVIFVPGSRTFLEILEMILRELKLRPDKKSKGAMLAQLQNYVSQKPAPHEALLIILDQAHELGRETLEDVRLLGNPDPRRTIPFQEILVALPEIEQKLNSWDLRQLKQRIVLKRSLGPLTEEESRRYIEFQLKSAGGDGKEIYTPEAISLICLYGKGIPRIINLLGQITLCTGYGLSKRKIDRSVCQEIFSILQKGKSPVWQKVRSSMDGLIGTWRPRLRS